MATDTGFGAGIKFLDKLGVYDVVLPFLLVFTIVFAILEKTRILGVDKSGGEEYTKKNLNAIVAFVIAFLVIASTSLVRAINDIFANVVLLIVLVISFLMLVGLFFGTGEVNLDKFPGWTRFFMVLIFLAIIAIFLNAMGWLELIFGLFFLNFNLDWVAALALLIIVIFFMWFITRENSPAEKKSNGDK
jgi:hypothetical protein